MKLAERRYLLGKRLAWLGLLMMLLAIKATAIAQPTSNTALKTLQADPEFELQEVNHLQLKIAPSLGTQLYFPFVLDQMKSIVPFTINVTNSKVFLIKVDPKRNFILISVPPQVQADEVGSLFIVVADRHLNIRLGIGRHQEHIEAVYFKFNNEVRQQLIDTAVTRVRQELEQEMHSRIAQVRQTSRSAAIAYLAELAQVDPKTYRPRQIITSDQIEFYLDRIAEYDNFTIFYFELTAQENHELGEIEAVKLKVREQGSLKIYNGHLRCEASAPNEREKCATVIDGMKKWQTYDEVSFEISSAMGLASFQY